MGRNIASSSKSGRIYHIIGGTVNKASSSCRYNRRNTCTTPPQFGELNHRLM